MTNREMEFGVLRQTIASRGTTRVVIHVVSLVAWAAIATALGLLSDLPLLAVIPLCVLASGHEAVWSLHAGVERVGRFIQVHYEGAADGPRWETVAMRVGPALPGGGVNPLFSVVVAGAALVNLAEVFVAEPTPIEVVLLFGCHAAFLLRVAQTRVLAARQRRADLAAFSTALDDPPSRGDGHQTSPEYEKS